MKAHRCRGPSAAARSLTLLTVLMLTACGGGSSGGGLTVTTGSNVAALIVDAGPAGTSVNLPFVTVTICVPGTSTCQSVDHVLLDSGSTGLRIIASALPAAVSGALPQSLTENLAGNPPANPMFECIQFADGYSWGSVRNADVQIADGAASNVPIHLIGDATAPAVPSDCAAGPPENTVEAFGANGVLGVNVFREDCGSACATIIVPAAYYGCPAGGSCDTTVGANTVPLGVKVSLPLQVANPIYYFATNNNGVVIELPTLSSVGQLAARGALILGIDTQSNNQLGSATFMTVDPLTGFFTTDYAGQPLPSSFIDSGSNGLFFGQATAALPDCPNNPGFYCPSPAVTLSATNHSHTGITSTVQFNVANADTLTAANPSFSAFNDVAGSNPIASSFDWGLPFFYGRRVYFGFEGRSASAGSGPFNAY
jgi:hypothetical protein